ncbi:hypothetical protein F4801DRAFT_603494 [Xylaria longipes]|nr:hypothetical protein F4801DRAFT_603494 [Xylaria longipes]
MDSGPARIPNYGKAANVGQVEMKDQHNNFAPGAETVSIKDESYQTKITNNFRISNQGAIPPPWPDNDVATWMACRSGVPIPWEQVVWNKSAGDYVSAARSVELTDEVRRQWRQTEESVRKLNEAVMVFQSKHGESEKSEGVNAEDVARFIEHSIHDELKNAIDHYSRDFRKQSSVLGSLRDINANIAAFLLWLKALHTDEHRYSLLSTLRCIIGAITMDRKLDDGVIETVATVVRAFGSNLDDYMATIKTGRLTAAMETETIEIYQSIVAIFVPLLKCQGRRLKPSQRASVDTKIVDLDDRLFSANKEVRNRYKWHQIDSIHQNSDISRGDDPSLVVRHFYHFLLEMNDNQPLMTRQKSGGVMVPLGPGGRETQRARQSSTLQNDPGISAATLIDYLDYDATAVIADVEKCLQLNPIAKDMRKLATFTRQDVYQSWLSDESKCSALLVHGMSTQNGLVSPLSHLCARISKEYIDEDKIIVLSYFCGLRVLAGNPGAVDLLCQLIGQLLSHKAVVRIYTRDPVERNWRKKIKGRDLNTLLEVFSSIVRRLRQCALVIFCVIDSVTKIETGKLRKNTEIVLKQLSELVREQKSRGRKGDDRMVFKLLVTDAARSLVAHNFFSSRDTVNLIAGGFVG